MKQYFLPLSWQLTYMYVLLKVEFTARYDFHCDDLADCYSHKLSLLRISVPRDIYHYAHYCFHMQTSKFQTSSLWFSDLHYWDGCQHSCESPSSVCMMMYSIHCFTYFTFILFFFQCVFPRQTAHFSCHWPADAWVCSVPFLNQLNGRTISASLFRVACIIHQIVWFQKCKSISKFSSIHCAPKLSAECNACAKDQQNTALQFWFPVSSEQMDHTSNHTFSKCLLLTYSTYLHWHFIF
jgi:hypothetical protein